jgi:hypothetical protein
VPVSNAVLHSLSNALDYKDSCGNNSDDCGEDENNDSNTDGANSPASEKKSSERSPESEQVVDLFSLVSKRGLSSAPQTISAGRWISFQHKVPLSNSALLFHPHMVQTRIIFDEIAVVVFND